MARLKWGSSRPSRYGTIYFVIGCYQDSGEWRLTFFVILCRIHAKQFDDFKQVAIAVLPVQSAVQRTVSKFTLAHSPTESTA